MANKPLKALLRAKPPFYWWAVHYRPLRYKFFFRFFNFYKLVFLAANNADYFFYDKKFVTHVLHKSKFFQFFELFSKLKAFANFFFFFFSQYISSYILFFSSSLFLIYHVCSEMLYLRSLF